MQHSNASVTSQHIAGGLQTKTFTMSALVHTAACGNGQDITPISYLVTVTYCQGIMGHSEVLSGDLLSAWCEGYKSLIYRC